MGNISNFPKSPGKIYFPPPHRLKCETVSLSRDSSQMHLLPDSGLSPEHSSPSRLPTPAHPQPPLHVEPLEWGSHVGPRSVTDTQGSLLRDPQPQSTPSRGVEAIVPPSDSCLSPLHSMEDLPAASILSSLCGGPYDKPQIRGGRDQKENLCPSRRGRGREAWITGTQSPELGTHAH